MSDFLILYGWSSCGFKYHIWHQRKHSLSSFFILTNPFVEFRSSAGRGICELPFVGSYTTLFFSELASGRNPRNPAIWLVPKAGGFLRSSPLTWAESLAASFTSLLFMNEQNWWFLTIFLFKLALLLALVRKKWILLFRKNIWRENQASQPRKPLK